MLLANVLAAIVFDVRAAFEVGLTDVCMHARGRDLVMDMSWPPGVPPHRREQRTGGPFVRNLVRDRHDRPHVVAAISVSDDLAAIIVRRNSIMNTAIRSEEHTSELQSLMRISYAVFCLKKKK